MDNNDLAHTKDGGIERLLHIMRRLRDPLTGCPWDIEQTFASVARYTIEEAYEVADAIEREDMADLKGELGDLLLQTVYHTTIGEEDGLFTFHSVADAISEKMVARHPHVFSDQSRDKSSEQQTIDWETIKAVERASADQTRALDGVALGLPALTRAVKLQKRAARVGFDWPEINQVLDKLREEILELTEAKNPKHQHEEFGDLMFVMANLARHMKIDPEQSLKDANKKFTRRFNEVEKKLNEKNTSPVYSSLLEMDALWDEVKREEK
ncbi:MAG: nucleoside triphosphate pyrophosphohydrolase [Planktomarina sp.]|nr:nucleoside triphosphate pyrophosphohydrolase [Planktomarina sp.]